MSDRPPRSLADALRQDLLELASLVVAVFGILALAYGVIALTAALQATP